MFSIINMHGGDSVINLHISDEEEPFLLPSFCWLYDGFIVYIYSPVQIACS
jgi:hypothetical protein